MADGGYSDTEEKPHITAELLNRGRQWRNLGTSNALSQELLTADTSVRSPNSRSLRRRQSSIIAENLIRVHKPLASNVDKYEVAACYVKDALHGRRPATCIHSRWTLRAMWLQRSAAFNQLFNFAVLLHCLLPVLEVPPCGPGWTCSARSVGHWTVPSPAWHGLPRPTVLLSSVLEVPLCLFYVLELYLVWLVRDRCSGRSFAESSTIWPIVRMVLVGLLAVDLTGFFIKQAILGKYWYRWGRLVVPHVLTLKRTYLQLFAAGLVRMIPRVLPVVILISFVTFFWGYVGYLLFHNKTFGKHLPFLEGLGFFQYILTSVRTMLRVFTSIPFMLDLEELYHDIGGIRIFTQAYGLVSVIFLGSLVVAVANKLFQQQNAQAYMAVRTQRALALRCAYTLVRSADGTVPLTSWLLLMAKLRPKMPQQAAAVLFRSVANEDATAANVSGSNRRRSMGGIRLSRDEFYEVCAMAGADVKVNQRDLSISIYGSSGRKEEAEWFRRKRVRRIRRVLKDALNMRLHCCCCWNVRPHVLVFNLMVLLQAVQLVLMAVSGEEWTNRLGIALLTYFWVDSLLHLFVLTPANFFARWDLRVGLALNIVGAFYRCVWWLPGEAAKDVYTVIMSLRVVLLWRLLQDYDGHHTDVASRLMLIVPAMVRAFLVLLSIVYSFSVLAYGMLCGSAIGTGNLDEYRTEPLVMRWMNYKDVISFESFAYSFKCLLDILMVSNWPLFMDAAVATTGREWVVRTFFYVYKVYIFYIVSPVMMGFIVQAYMATRSADEMPRRSAASLGFASDTEEGGEGDGHHEDGHGNGNDDDASGSITTTETSPRKRKASITQMGRTMSAMYFGQTAQDPQETQASRDLHALEVQLELMGKELLKRDDALKQMRRRLLELEARSPRNGGGNSSVSSVGGLGSGAASANGGYGTLDNALDTVEEKESPETSDEEEVSRGLGGGHAGGEEDDEDDDEEAPWVHRRSSSLLLL